MVFTTTHAIRAYHHWCCEMNPSNGELYSIQHFVIKFVSDLRQIGDFFSSTNKTDLPDINGKKMLKVGLNTKNPNPCFSQITSVCFNRKRQTNSLTNTRQGLDFQRHMSWSFLHWTVRGETWSICFVAISEIVDHITFLITEILGQMKVVSEWVV